LAGRTHNPASSSKYRYVAEKREGEVWTLREVLCQKEPILHHKWPFHVVAPQARRAGVAELVDARVSKTRFFGSAGSIPAARTIVQRSHALDRAASAANYAVMFRGCLKL
jgi:hypothetical protein